MMAESILRTIAKDAEPILSGEGFVRSGNVADRHGALQVVFISSRADVDRFIVLAELVGNELDTYAGIVEVLACHAELTLRAQVSIAKSPVEFRRMLVKSLQQSVEMLDGITAFDFETGGKGDDVRPIGSEQTQAARVNGPHSETFSNLAAFLNSLDAEDEQHFELSNSLVIICPNCGKNIAFRGGCPKCGSKSWVPAGVNDELARQIREKGLERALRETTNAWNSEPKDRE